MAHQKEQTDKVSCSKCDFTGETDNKLYTDIVLEHFKINFSGVQQIDKYECNECADCCKFVTRLTVNGSKTDQKEVTKILGW